MLVCLLSPLFLLPRPSVWYLDHVSEELGVQVVLSNNLEKLEYLLECCRHFCTSESQNGRNFEQEPF